MKLTDEQLQAVNVKEGNVLINASFGSGKALKNSHVIKTPNGDKKIKDMVVGDKVFGVDGNIYSVTGVYPQGKLSIWEVEFNDGTIIECCKDHLWTYQTKNMRNKAQRAKKDHNSIENFKTSSLEYIYNNEKLRASSGWNIYIPIASPVKYPEQDLPIDPYLLGALIGDGGLSELSKDRHDIKFSNSEPDVVDKVNRKLNEIDYYLSELSDGNYRVSSLLVGSHHETGNNLFAYIKELGLDTTSINKHIPNIYLRSSKEQRVQLLNGLIDTDSYLGSGNSYEYYTSSKLLAYDVCELAQSLGMHSLITTRENVTYQHKGELLTSKNTAYRVRIKTSKKIPKIHTSLKHEKKWKRPQSFGCKSIRRITPTNKRADMTCISVDAPNKLYMTDNYIVTHNTATFAARIANLIKNHNVDSKDILGLTFTRNAAENMRARLSKVIGKDKAEKVYLTTFHSFALSMLKRYTSDYTNIKIVEPWFENQVANDIVNPRSYNNKDGQDLGVNAGTFLDFVSYQKSRMVRKGDKVIIDHGTPLFAEWERDKLQNGYNTYCTRLENAHKKSFDDMLLNFYYLLLFNDEVREGIKYQYKYIQVDEFQDTSLINMEILKLISNNNIYVVGDINQSITGFQGAEIGNILSFSEEFEDVKTINLKDNFRSTARIIDICNDLLQYRGADSPLNQFGKQVPARSIEGEPVRVSVYNNIQHETQDIADKIEDMMDKDKSLTYNDFAIISRTNNGLLSFENELSNREIPVIISSGRSFYDRREIDDLLSYARLYLGEDDDSFRKVANRPNRFIANTMLRDLEEYAFNNVETLEESARGDFDAGKHTSGLNRFLYKIEDIRDIKSPRNAEQLLRSIYQITGYHSFMESKTMSMSELSDKEESIDSLMIAARGFKSIEQFLTYISIVKENQRKNDDGVTLTTVHSAKGLEWKICFVIGVTDNNYPHKMLASEDKDEELRLLFVAMGRAKDRLFISLPMYDGLDDVKEVSRFIQPLFGDKLLQAKNKVLGGVEKSEFDY